MDADGSIVIRAELDDKQAQAELNRLTKKIDGLQEKLRRAQAERLPLVDQANELAARLDEAKAKLDMLQTGGASADKIAEQQELVKNLQAQWNAAMRQVESYDHTIAKTNQDIAWESEKAGGLSARLADVGDAGEDAGDRVSAAMEQVGKRIDKVGKRIAGLIKRVFFFSLITKALRGVRTWFSDIVKTNDEATAAIGRFKGALLTLAQPLVNVVIPAFTALLNIVTKVILALASFISGIFGTTAKESANAAKNLNEEKKAIKGVGGAAKKAEGQLAAFDQINKLTAEDAAGGGGSAEDIQPSFDFDDFVGEDELNNILRIVEAIGAALLAWRLGRALGMDFVQMIGLALLFYNTIEFIKAFMDAWNNGINMDNLLDMLLALAGAAVGAALAFGTLGAAIVLIVGGLALLTVGFKDLYENGMDLENTLTIISGLFAGGLGLSLLTGSFVPLAIAALADLVLWLVYTQGEGELFTEGIRDIFDGLGKFFKSVFAGDMEGAIEGLKQVWEGLQKVGEAVARATRKAWEAFLDWVEQKLGPNWRAVFEGLDEFFTGIFTQDMGRAVQGIKKAWEAFLGWLDGKLGPKWKQFFESIGEQIGWLVDDITDILRGLITFLSGAFTNDAQKVNDGLMQLFKGTANLVLGIVGGMVNVLIKGLNWLISQMNKISFDVPDWVPGIGGMHVGISIPSIPEWQVPRLAQGAVIPPNREFMAVLGDQKSGTNIEAPLETIVQAFRQAVREMNGGDQRVEVRVYLDSREIKAGQQRLSRVTGG